MPLAYFVSANGRTGAALRVARGAHELLATGPAARLGTLVPHSTTISVASSDGRPLEVRVPFMFVLWLVLGCLVASEEVAEVYVYMYIVGASRLGAALDLLLDSITDLFNCITRSVFSHIS